jgi:hypothetical protein
MDIETVSRRTEYRTTGMSSALSCPLVAPAIPPAEQLTPRPGRQRLAVVRAGHWRRRGVGAGFVSAVLDNRDELFPRHRSAPSRPAPGGRFRNRYRRAVLTWLRPLVRNCPSVIFDDALTGTRRVWYVRHRGNLDLDARSLAGSGCYRNNLNPVRRRSPVRRTVRLADLRHRAFLYGIG